MSPATTRGESRTLTDEHNYVVLSDSFSTRPCMEIGRSLDERPRPLTPAEVPKPRFADDRSQATVGSLWWQPGGGFSERRRRLPQALRGRDRLVRMVAGAAACGTGFRCETASGDSAILSSPSVSLPNVSSSGRRRHIRATSDMVRRR